MSTVHWEILQTLARNRPAWFFIAGFGCDLACRLVSYAVVLFFTVSASWVSMSIVPFGKVANEMALLLYVLIVILGYLATLVHAIEKYRDKSILVVCPGAALAPLVIMWGSYDYSRRWILGHAFVDREPWPFCAGPVETQTTAEQKRD